MEKVYLCLGGNIGDTRNYLQNAVAMIGRRIGRVVSQSAVYQSEPWGFNAEQMFLNQVVVAETELEPHAVLELCLQIEAELGSTRSARFR